MAKLTIKKRGHFWVLLEGRLGIDAFPTKARALDEKRWRKLWAGERLRQLQHADQMAKTPCRRSLEPTQPSDCDEQGISDCADAA
jgi:hypothetical protein